MSDEKSWIRVGCIAAILILVCAICWKFWLFKQVQSRGDFGVATMHWEWGLASELTFDSNDDGLVDQRYRYGADSKYFYTDVPPEEGWLDSDFDGHFEIHVLFGPGLSRTVELDTNGDSSYDTKLTGAEAEAYFEKMQKVPVLHGK